MSDQHSDNDRAVDDALRAWTPMEPPADLADRVLAARTLAPPVVRSKRAWWLAAPVAAAAMVAIVLFATSSSDQRAASREAVEAQRVSMSPSATTGTAGAEQVAYGSAAASDSATVRTNPPALDAGVLHTQTPAAVDSASSPIAIVAGASATVHDLSPTTTVQIDFGARCPTGAAVSAFRERDGNRDGSTATASGLTRAVIAVDRGVWKYEVWCSHDPGTLAAEGTIRVERDDGRRKVPNDARLLEIDADGRTWPVAYHARIPDVRVRVPSGAKSVRVYKTGRLVEDVTVEAGVALLAGLEEDTYTLELQPPNARWKQTTMVVDHDERAPVLSIGRLQKTRVAGQVQIDRGLYVNGAHVITNKDGSFEADVGLGVTVLRVTHSTYEQHFFVLLPLTK